jgi:hypothetical protein
MNTSETPESGQFETPPDTTATEESLLKEISDALSADHDTNVSADALALLVPKILNILAENPANIEIRKSKIDKGRALDILIIERDYPRELTDREAYRRWKQDKEIKLKQSQERGEILVTLRRDLPGIDRLHMDNGNEIDQGRLSFSDRILMTCMLKKMEKKPGCLYVAKFDGEKRKGIGQDFYLNTLPSLCRKIGIRFLVGLNNAKNISFYREKLGRFTLKQIKPEFRHLFFESADDTNTVQFLYPEDAEKYVIKKDSDFDQGPL